LIAFFSERKICRTTGIKPNFAAFKAEWLICY